LRRPDVKVAGRGRYLYRTVDQNGQVIDVLLSEQRDTAAARRFFVRALDRSAFAGFRFPPEVIAVAVRWYLRYGLSYRDVEELLAERGIEVDHVTVYRWVQRFTPLFVDAARPRRACHRRSMVRR
jgi:transposase, IS6 family